MGVNSLSQIPYFSPQFWICFSRVLQWPLKQTKRQSDQVMCFNSLRASHQTENKICKASWDLVPSPGRLCFLPSCGQPACSVTTSGKQVLSWQLIHLEEEPEAAPGTLPLCHSTVPYSGKGGCVPMESTTGDLEREHWISSLRIISFIPPAPTTCQTLGIQLTVIPRGVKICYRQPLTPWEPLSHPK